jgi:hypothetical protein
MEWSEDAWEWRNTQFYDDYDNLRFAITLPGLGADSVIDCKVTLIGKAGRKQIFHETIRPRMLGTSPINPHIATIGPYRPGPVQIPQWVWWQPPRIEGGGKQYGGQLKVDDSLYSSAEVELRYWPNQTSMPNFVLPKALEQRLLVASD